MEDAELIKRLRDEVRCLSEEAGRWESQYWTLKVYTETLSKLNDSYWKNIVRLRKKVGLLGGHVEDDE